MSEREVASGKIPPQNMDAEKSLLGAILIDEEVLPDVVETVKAVDFYDKRHELIFDGMMLLYEQHKPVDLLTLTDVLKKKKSLDKVGGSSYLAELTNYVPTSAHSGAYADIVAKCAVRRRLIKASVEISEKAYDEEGDIPELLGSAEAELFNVSDRSVKNDLISLESILAESFDRLDELHKNKGTLRGLKTGFRDLDHKTAGLQKSDLIIVGARPAMGKTTFATNLAYNVATINKKAVLVFSLEMSKDQLVDRMLADVSGVDSWKLRTGNLSDEDFSKISEAMGEMAETPLFIDDSSGLTITELRTKARRAAHEHDLGLIIIDYLQLMQGGERYAGNRVQEVTEISRGLKIIAKELNIPVVALAQLSRSVTGREDPRPVLSDLRESGSIEQDADIVVFLHRPDYYRQNEDDYEDTHITELLIAKHRNGPVGKIELYFHPEYLRFMSLDKDRSSEG